MLPPDLALNAEGAGQLSTGDRSQLRPPTPTPALPVAQAARATRKSPRRGASRAIHRQWGKVSQEAKKERSARSAGPRSSQCPAPQQAMPAALVEGAAISELENGIAHDCRCGTLLLYRAPVLRGSGFRITRSELRWRYGDSNPISLACHPAATRPPECVAAGHRPGECTGVRLRPGLLRYFPAVRPDAPFPHKLSARTPTTSTAYRSAKSCPGQRPEMPCSHAPTLLICMLCR
jgi:hypothetical protein